MPGPGNKRKSKAKTNANTGHSTSSVRTETLHVQCNTLDEDGITRCDELATEGYPKPNRCKVHHGQYRTLCKKYNDASETVDRVKHGSELPTQERIDCYMDWRAVLEKAQWVRKYLEAIRVEKTGRETHQNRFFLQVDDGHRRRLKSLEEEMVRVVDVLDALQSRAYQLYQDQIAVRAMEEADKSRRTAREAPKPIRHSTPWAPKERVTSVPHTLGAGDEDLIRLSLRDQKEAIISVLRPYFDLEAFTDFHVELGKPRPQTEHDKLMMKTQFFVYQQFIRRIVFHEPTLFRKSVDKVSFKDFVLSDNFSEEDLAKFIHLFSQLLGFPLRWFKDAVLDALAESHHGTAANLGSAECRLPVLGGWVHNRGHTVSMSNKAWWHLLTMLPPLGNVESCFVRVCNNFDDLIGFLSFGAFGFVPGPNFCVTCSEFEECSLSRTYLSLSGIVVADISTIPPPILRGPIPTSRKGTKENCIIWSEVQTRSYMFGAVRNEHDTFTDAFLRELRARPDLFQVVLRSETAPGRQVEMFGSGPSGNDALPAIRVRQFEAPPSPSPPPIPASTSDKWEVTWSATDVLYGSKAGQDQVLGYLTMLARDHEGQFFRFKSFPVTYFVILDTIPYRDASVLARNVAWAALRARGYAEGEYTPDKYEVASDKLLDRCLQERVGWIIAPLSTVSPVENHMDSEWNLSGIKDYTSWRRMRLQGELPMTSFPLAI